MSEELCSFGSTAICYALVERAGDIFTKPCAVDDIASALGDVTCNEVFVE